MIVMSPNNSAWYAAYLNALLENPTRLSMMKMEIIRNIKLNLKPYNPVAMINEEYDVEGYQSINDERENNFITN